jgi:hypothetical protein
MYKVVFYCHLFVLYFTVQHKQMHNFKLKSKEKNPLVTFSHRDEWVPVSAGALREELVPVSAGALRDG